MNTAGRSSGPIRPLNPYRSSKSAGIRRFSTWIRRSTAPVVPLPQNTTACSSVAPTQRRTIARASSRNRVVCNPVPDDSVCVLAYSGSTASRTKSSMNDNERPDAV
jgi:hypothetical protein